jgi:uncharacterized protein (TIGR02598 family)
MKTMPHAQQGFSLVEVTFALGVAAFALVVILGLFPVGIGAQQASLNETTATNVATGIIADLRQVPSAYAISLNSNLSTVSSRYGVDVSQATTTIYLDESGTKQSSAAQARYKATISLTQPAVGTRSATYGSIAITWPPTSAVPVGSVTVFVALNRN